MSAISTPLPTPPDNFSTQIASATVASSAITFNVDDASGLPTEGVGVLFKKDSSGDIVAGSIEFIHWTGVSGNTINLSDTGDRGLSGSDSGAQSYVADDYFEVWVSSYYYDSQYDAFTAEHNTGGTHGAVTADSIDINGTISITGTLDEDDMASNSAVKLATQQSIKAYVDNNTSGGWVLYSAVVPTRSVSDDPTYEITFASVDLTGTLSAGMRMKFAQDGTVRYFIITKVALDGADTDVTLYGGTDYDVGDTASLTISALSYSPHKAPQGFPLDPTKWQVLVEDTSNRSQATAVQNTWYNAGSISIDIPIGSWNVSYEGIYKSSDTNCYITLSTANNSESDKDWTCLNEGTDYNTVHREKFLVLSTKDTYYLNYRTTGAGTPTLILRGDLGTTRIKADCTYL